MVIRNKLDAVAAGCLLATMGFAYAELQKVDNLLNYALGPAFVPRLLVGVIAILSIVLLVQSIEFRATAKERERSETNRKVLLQQAALIGFLALYILSLPWLGYITATIVFLFVAMSLLGSRTPRQIAIYLAAAAGTTCVLYYVFARLLLLFLP